MIDKTNLIETVMERLQKIPKGHYLDLRSYKRNRSLIIVKNTEDEFTIIEDGFSQEKYRITNDKIRKLLTVLLKKEFPRSHKIRLYTMGLFNENDAGKARRKIL